MGKELLVIIGSIASLIAIAGYIRDTLKGTTKPNRVTWLMWTIAPMIAFFAAASQGLTWSLLPGFMSGFGPLLVLIASFLNPKSYWKLKPFDYLCGALSILAMILWAITKDINIAIIFSILSDGLAAVPTLTKSWVAPESETVAPFIVGMLNALAGIIVATQFVFNEVGFNIYLVIINILITSTIIFSRSKHNAKTEKS
jgi:hypothetical protein